MFAAGVHQKVQPVMLFLQILQLDDIRFAIGVTHIVDFKYLKVADHNPAGLLRLGQIAAVPPPLLKWGQHCPIRLALTLSQVNLESLLLNQHTGRGYVAVNIFGGSRAIIVHDLHPLFKFHDLRWLLHAIDILKHGKPKPLGILLLIAASLPVCRKLLCSTALLYTCHVLPPLGCSYGLV